MVTTAVTLRFFAAAREAAGGNERLVELPRSTPTIAGVLAALEPDPRFASVLGRCSFLLNGIAADAAAPVAAGDAIDVLPPFAGG